MCGVLGQGTAEVQHPNQLAPQKVKLGILFISTALIICSVTIDAINLGGDVPDGAPVDGEDDVFIVEEDAGVVSDSIEVEGEDAR